MKKSILVTLIVISVGIGAYYYANNSPTETKIVTEEVLPNTKTAKTDVATMAGQPARYLEYSQQVLSDNSASRRILFFYATWCPSCKIANADFEQNANKIPQDTVVIRVNYNDQDVDQYEKELAKKHGITYQHTFVQIDENGESITKWNGGGMQELLDNIK